MKRKINFWQFESAAYVLFYVETEECSSQKRPKNIQSSIKTPRKHLTSAFNVILTRSFDN